MSGWVGGREDMLVLNDQTKTGGLHWLRSLPEQVRQKAGSFIRQHLSPEVAGVYKALLIGSQAAVSPQIQEQFKVTGTTHILSISGLHISLLALLVSALLNKLLRRSRWLLLHTHVPTLALLGTLPLLLLYSLIAGMNTPVLRSLIMAAALLGAVILRRRHDMLHLLAVAALNPLALFTASFQLSFSAVAALILFLPQIMPPAKTDGSRRVAYLRSAVLASVAATVGTLPLVLLHFHRFSLVGPLMNLLLEPLLCFWALPWGLAAIPCIFVWPQLASVLLKIGSVGIWAGLHGTAITSALPWASIWTINNRCGDTFLWPAPSPLEPQVPQDGRSWCRATRPAFHLGYLVSGAIGQEQDSCP
ncbi:ComEC/Rec2 family competence protein [Desulfobulbus sp. F5]|nr:ComEC/Rec2 family competence protein [Desulfobulbus sp. F5]